MENSEIAKIFEEIADILEIKGENPFRIRSYRNAALVIGGLAVSLKSIVEGGEKKLESIPGIGTSIREKVVEMLATGKCKFHEELLKELPSGLLDLLRVSGVGPKKVALLYNKVGISTVEELEKAARAHKLCGLPGMGEKSEQKILKAVQEAKRVSGRFRLSVASSIAEDYRAYMKKLKGVINVEPSGSLRRWKETIGDLDILVTCKSGVSVMDHFVNYPEVREVVAKGDTKSTVILKNGLQVDLRVLDKKSFGSALQYFTGSKAHNIAVRDRAKRMGLKISEYGVFREKGDKWVAGEAEEDVYRAVGLEWVPPELRENRGEIEAAEAGKLPDLVKLSHIRGDLHVHTTESDGVNTLEEMARAAMEMGYEYIGVTEHSKGLGIAHGLEEKRLLKHMEAIDRFNERLKKKGVKFRVLKGTEVDIRADGRLDYDGEILEKLDCVVGAVHSGFDMPAQEMTGRIIKGMSTGYINILAHPTGRLIETRKPYEVDMERVIYSAKKYGVFLELNSYPDRLDLNDIHCKLARDIGVLVVISTDAHNTLHLKNIVYGVHTARRGWLSKKDVLNTRPLKELLKFLGREKIKP
jgi:DNA polymerase (family 10)